MARIYISSTFEDLKDLRQVVANTVRKLGHIAIAMEDYRASSQRPLDKCLEDVISCKVYIGIFALRYGTIPEGYEKSITHLEYEEARKNDIPCLIFLLRPDAAWPTTYVSIGEEREKIDALRDSLRKNHVVSFFGSQKELFRQVKEAVKEEGVLQDEIPSQIAHNTLKRLKVGLLIVVITAIFVFIILALPLLKNDFIGTEIIKSIESNPRQKLNEVKIKGFMTKTNLKGFREADLGDGIILIYIPAGEFIMGSYEYFNERPTRSVYLDGYWIGKTEMTVGQYMKFADDKHSHYPVWRESGSEYNINKGEDNLYKQMGEALTSANHPIVGISWNDAVAYCQWLSVKTRIKITLPTEAQWEKAARGTDGNKYPWGNDEVNGKIANIADKQFTTKFPKRGDKTIDDGFIFTSPVESFPAGSSPFGVMGMADNVWEWCQDCYIDDYYKKSPKENPMGPMNSRFRVVRGGSWFLDRNCLRCSYRNYDFPNQRRSITGFRIACNL